MEDTTSIWNKKQDELTVGDSMKVMGIATAVSVAATFAIFGGIAVGTAAYEKYQNRRATKQFKKQLDKV